MLLHDPPSTSSLYLRPLLFPTLETAPTECDSADKRATTDNRSSVGAPQALHNTLPPPPYKHLCTVKNRNGPIKE
jgi:hypothetical protein